MILLKNKGTLDRHSKKTSQLNLFPFRKNQIHLVTNMRLELQSGCTGSPTLG